MIESICCCVVELQPRRLRAKVVITSLIEVMAAEQGWDESVWAYASGVCTTQALYSRCDVVVGFNGLCICLFNIPLLEPRIYRVA